MTFALLNVFYKILVAKNGAKYMELTRRGAKTKKDIDITEYFSKQKVEVHFLVNTINLRINEVEDGKGNTHNYEVSLSLKEFFEILEELTEFITSGISENDIDFLKETIKFYLTTKTNVLLKLLLMSSGLLNNSGQKNEKILGMLVQNNEIIENFIV